MAIDLALILVSLLLVLLNGFFVAAEFAIVKLRHTRVSAIADERGFRGRILAKVHGNLDAYLSACQLGITLASLGLGWIGEPAFADLLTPMFEGIGIDDPGLVSGIAFFVAFLTIAYLHIVVGELAPKSMAIRMSERVALWTAAPLFAFYWLMYPFIRGLNSSAFWLLRKFKLDATTHADDGYSIDEIKLILRSSSVDSSLTRSDWRTLAQAMDFGEAEVADLMRPFRDAIVIEQGTSLSDSLSLMAKHRLSRYPFVDREGCVLGVLHTKDLLLALHNDRSTTKLESIRRPALLVPPTLPATDLFRSFRLEGQHMAIVGYPDEVPRGLLTFDDLLSALIGRIRDEFGATDVDWSRLEDGTIVARGSLPIFTLEQTLGLDLDEEANGARTVGGMILERLDRLPAKGERIEFAAFTVEIEAVQKTRIAKLRILPKRLQQDGAPAV